MRMDLVIDTGMAPTSQKTVHKSASSVRTNLGMLKPTPTIRM